MISYRQADLLESLKPKPLGLRVIFDLKKEKPRVIDIKTVRLVSDDRYLEYSRTLKNLLDSYIDEFANADEFGDKISVLQSAIQSVVKTLQKSNRMTNEEPLHEDIDDKLEWVVWIR
jgi:hypothetical protein